MKKTMRFLSMAALALVGAVMTGCSSDDAIVDPQQPGNNVVTLKTTVSLDDGGTTRALDGSGHKTFAVGETMALIYKNTSGETVKAVSAALTAADIDENNSKSAEFTFTLENPNKEVGVVYIYPAAMATASGDYINRAALYTEQDGTLAKLGSNFDFSWNTGSWVDGNLSSATLINQLAILAITLKNSDGTRDITSSITGLTITQDSYTYTINRDAAEGPIYVAIIPTSEDDITITATDDETTYTKALTGKTYAAGNGYNVSWRMVPAPSYDNTLNINTYDPELNNWEKVTVPTGKHWLITGTGEATTNVITIANNATVTLSGVNITAYGRSITCLGNATIILADGTTNNLYSAEGEWGAAGIEMSGGSGTSLTIQGNTGMLNITSGGGPAIGAAYDHAGCAINIEGGIINATSTDGPGIGAAYNTACGNITISGGTVAATGGYGCPGIGGASSANCGDITITSNVTSVTATKGSGAPYSIGASSSGSSGTVTIEDPSKVTQN